MRPRSEGVTVEPAGRTPGERVVETPGRSVAERPEGAGGSESSTRRLAALSGVITILILDLLALDDITTAGAWAVEFAFLVASVPALLFLGHMALKKPRERGELEEGEARRELTEG